MKHKKFSSAILCGFELVDGRQHVGWYCDGDSRKPRAVCVLGAARLCETGDADGGDWNGANVGEIGFANAFEYAWGFAPNVLNDEGMPWEHIYGMAVAAGL